MKRRHFFAGAASLALSLYIPNAFAKKTIRVGCTAGPHSDILHEVQKNARTMGFNFDIIEFTDYVTPNQALDDGSIDINVFQHEPFLLQQKKDRGYDITTAALTVTFPLTAYAGKGLKTIQDIKVGARVGIPNDPTNGSRALYLLASAGLLTLDPKAGDKATVLDIADNPKGLRITELEAAQLPRSLPDFDVCVINGNFAIPAGLNPKKDGLMSEPANGPYANIIAVRSKDLNAPWVKQFISFYQTPAIKTWVQNQFKGIAVCAW